MADICVVYLSDDEAVVERLVSLLEIHWTVWWARDIAHGDWEVAVRAEISNALAVVPVLSAHARGPRLRILKDEMEYARACNKPILPFVVGAAEVPFGYGGLDRTSAEGWNGGDDAGFRELQSKLRATLGAGSRAGNKSLREKELKLGRKTLLLPDFAFSLSSHETQISPEDGATILSLLSPSAVLFSAYDAWRYKRGRRRSVFRSAVNQLRASNSVVFLDSGNYEAYRKDDLATPKKNPAGWARDLFWETAAAFNPDLAFCFDQLSPKGSPKAVTARIIKRYFSDDRALSKRAFPLCPIVHLSRECKADIARFASQIVFDIAKDLDPLLIAIPERELGDGLMARVDAVRRIRVELDTLDRYYPLHILGTGNPISMISLAVAGADSFDGLEWCRTVADYASGSLFHFQQFELFKESCLHRVQDQQVRVIMEDPGVPYVVKTVSYNIDFFKDWIRTARNMIHAGQGETLLKMVPSISSTLFKNLSA